MKRSLTCYIVGCAIFARCTQTITRTCLYIDMHTYSVRTCTWYLITFKMVQEYSHKQDIHGHPVTRISPAEEVCTSNLSNLCTPSICCCWGVLPKLLKGSSLNGVGPRARKNSCKGLSPPKAWSCFQGSAKFGSCKGCLAPTSQAW